MGGNEQDGSMVLSFVFELAKIALNGARTLGEKAAHLQLLDTDPDGPMEPEMHGYQGGPDTARADLGGRIGAGFDGLAGFTWIEQDGAAWVLRAEGFDTRNQTSVAAKLPLKKTMFGKFKPLRDTMELDGSPSFPIATAQE